MRKGYHDYKPIVKAEKKEPKIYKKGTLPLRILTRIPKPPIGHLMQMGNMIQTTDEKGNINVDNFVLMFGTQAPKPGANKLHMTDLTAQASRLLDK